MPRTQIETLVVERKDNHSTIYVRRGLSACFTRVALFILSSSPDINKTALATFSLCSPLVTDAAGSSPQGKVRRCNVHAVILGDGSYPLPACSDQRALSFSPKHRWRGRASDPFFLAAVVWEDPTSRSPTSDIPATIGYRNRPCSTSQAPNVAAFVSFTISQAPS